MLYRYNVSREHNFLAMRKLSLDMFNDKGYFHSFDIIKKYRC